MLPEILPESRLISEQNAELARTNLRPDLVYLIEYKGKQRILNLELQTSEDPDMTYRMLLYFVELFGKYRLPVISIVLYPFETSIPEPVLRAGSEDDTLLHYQHQVLRLWALEAEQYVRRGVVSMYTLLPAMKGVHASMLLKAITEMEQWYTGLHLARHLVRFRTILRRSTTLSAQEKQIVEERLHMYDSLLDEDPEIQERVAMAKIEGQIRGQQRAVLVIVETRFPALVEKAQKVVERLNKPDELNLLIKQITLAPDEDKAQWALDTLAA
jgi:hypothetical protein